MITNLNNFAIDVKIADDCLWYLSVTYDRRFTCKDINEKEVDHLLYSQINSIIYNFTTNNINDLIEGAIKKTYAMVNAEYF